VFKKAKTEIDNTKLLIRDSRTH